MSGISGGNYGGNRDLTDKEDAFYQRQIDAIRAGEKLTPPKRLRRRPAADWHNRPKADRFDVDANGRADA